MARRVGTWAPKLAAWVVGAIVARPSPIARAGPPPSEPGTAPRPVTPPPHGTEGPRRGRRQEGDADSGARGVSGEEAAVARRLETAVPDPRLSVPVLLLVLLLAVAAGFAGGAATGGFGLFEGEAAAGATPAPRLAPLESGRAAEGEEGAEATPRLMGSADAALREVEALRKERDTLARRLEEAEEALARLRSEAGGPHRGPTFTFGRGGQLPGVREADWSGLANASRNVLEGLGRILAALDAGEKPPREASLQIQENVERMRVYEYRTLDKLPTAAQHNGELTHPISITNLFAALLEDAGVALTEEQVRAIAQLGLRFEDDLEAVLAGPGPRVRRLVAEYRLKQRFMDDLYGRLTDAQRAVVVDPATHRIAGLDLYDPTLILIHTAPVLAAPDEEGIVKNLRDILVRKWGLDEAQTARLDPLLGTWRQRVRPLLEPTTKVRAKHYSADVAGKAGDATVELVEGALRDLDLVPAVREALEQDPSIYVPRLLAAQ